jgi:hypothetical protein
MSENPETYRTPTIFDFQRNLDRLIECGESEASAEKRRLTSEYSARGLSQSSMMTDAAKECFVKVYGDILDLSMKLRG